jgi:WD40 repeat protein
VLNRFRRKMRRPAGRALFGFLQAEISLRSSFRKSFRISLREVRKANFGSAALISSRSIYLCGALLGGVVLGTTSCNPMPHTPPPSSKSGEHSPGTSNIATVNNSNPQQIQGSAASPDGAVPYAWAPDCLDMKFEKNAAASSHVNEITALFVVPGSGRMLSVDRRGVALVHRNGKLPGMKLPLPESKVDVDIAQLSLDCKYLALTHKAELEVYSLDSFKPVAAFSRLRGRIMAIAFSPDSRTVVAARADGFIYRWKFLESPTGSQMVFDDRTLERYGGQASIPSSVLYHPYGRFFFGGDWSGNLSAWLNFDADPYGGKYDENLFAGRLFSEKQTRQLGTKGAGGAGDSVEHLAVTPDGNLLLVGLQGGLVQAWRVRGFEKVSETQAHTGYLYDMALSSDGKKLATLGRNGSVKLWDVVREDGEKNGDQGSRIVSAGEGTVVDGRRAAFFAADEVTVGDAHGKITTVKILPPATPTPTPTPAASSAASAPAAAATASPTASATAVPSPRRIP